VRLPVKLEIGVAGDDEIELLAGLGFVLLVFVDQAVTDGAGGPDVYAEAGDAEVLTDRPERAASLDLCDLGEAGKRKLLMGLSLVLDVAQLRLGPLVPSGQQAQQRGCRDRDQEHDQQRPAAPQRECAGGDARQRAPVGVVVAV
jgi:hypothetical protein